MRNVKPTAAMLLIAGTALALTACGDGAETNNSAMNAADSGFGNVADPTAVETMSNGTDMNGGAGAIGTGTDAGGNSGSGSGSGNGQSMGNSNAGADSGTGTGTGTNVGGDTGGNAAGGTSNGM